ncbi:hypothetical protein IFM89_024612 [Coptis chinensis]|uniref:peptidylprolyl isomerase n=1 Tax=Coptis chinensis TaxID=261450 RepID=A0A835I3V3_9MAGN|nr:hypothetical protein IFM89_024612 [Coptis chinensis]
MSLTHNNNLKSLTIWGSWHSSLPQGLNQLTSLQKLRFYYCEFFDFKPEELKPLTMLRKLYIRGCSDRTREEDWSIYPTIEIEGIEDLVFYRSPIEREEEVLFKLVVITVPVIAEGPFEFKMDEEQVIDGLDRAVMTMKKGEVAESTIAPEYGFGSSESKQEMAVVPPNSTLYYEVELESFVKERESWDMNTPEKIEAAGKKKKEGNVAFKAGKYAKASKIYEKAGKFIEYDTNFSEEEKKQSKVLKVSCNLNNAACKLKLKDYKQAEKLCSKVLELESTNVKALYRRAQGYIQLADLDLTALEIDPNNRAGYYAWMHKSWRVREEFARIVTSAIGLFASTELPLQGVILPPILQMLNDSNQCKRSSSTFYRGNVCTSWISISRRVAASPSSLIDDFELQVKDINARLEKIEPKIRSSNGAAGQFLPGEMKFASLSHKKSSPKNKNLTREISLTGGGSALAISISCFCGGTLVPDSGIVYHPLYILVSMLKSRVNIASGTPSRIKKLIDVDALGLSRLSVIVMDMHRCKRLFIAYSSASQAFHLLCLLSKELLGDFEACAQMFIPMLRNCKVARVLPRIADSAENDRNAVLRARYIYRASCLRWKVINEEEGGVHRRYASPSLRDKGVQSLRTPSQTPSSNVPGAGVDTPSARDPPFPLAVPSSSHLMDSVLADSTASNISRGSSQSSGLISTEPFSSYTAKRTFERLHDGSHIEENTDMRINSHYLNTHG